MLHTRDQHSLPPALQDKRRLEKRPHQRHRHPPLVRLPPQPQTEAGGQGVEGAERHVTGEGDEAAAEEDVEVETRSEAAVTEDGEQVE